MGSIVNVEGTVTVKEKDMVNEVESRISSQVSSKDMNLTYEILSFNMQTLQKGIYLLWEQRKEILFAQLLYSRKIWG